MRWNDELEIDSVEAGLQFLDSKLAVRLCRAFSRIQDVKVKQIFVELKRNWLADVSGGSPPPKIRKMHAARWPRADRGD